MRIVIPGGSGQVGHMIARHFHAAGHGVTPLAARAVAGCHVGRSHTRRLDVALGGQ
jgi:hypothetical protein